MPAPEIRVGNTRLLYLIAAPVFLSAPVSANSDNGSANALVWPRHQVGAFAGVLRQDINAVIGSGTVITAGPGSEMPNLLSPDSVDSSGGGINYAFNTGRKLPDWLDGQGRTSNLTFAATWMSYSGDESATNTVQPGSVDTGLLFTEPPKPTGYFPGAAGLESNVKIDVDYGYLEFAVQWLQMLDALPADSRFKPQVALGWNQFDYRVTTRDTFAPAAVSPDEYRNERDQYMQQDIFELNIGGELEKNFGSQGQYSLFGNVNFVTYFLKTSLASFEYVTLDGATRLRYVGPEGQREFSFGADFGLGMAWQMTPGWRASVRASYSPWFPLATINNPATPSSPRTFADTDSNAQTAILAGVSYGF
jgi:hypothetical protein